MKNFLLFIFFCANINYFCFAQSGGNVNKIETLFIGYMTKELVLTADEAQKFWPVYNSYRLDLKKARLEKKDELEWEEEVLKVRRKYKQEFKKIFNNDDTRANKVFIAERNFRILLNKEIRDRQGKGAEKPVSPEQEDN